MTIRNLHFAAHPKSVAVVGASDRKGTVGYVVLKNIIDGGFEGAIWPVNPKYRKLAGLKCYGNVAELPAVPDLGVIVTPPATVPGIISQLGAKGNRAAVVITAGLTQQNGLRQAVLDAAQPYLFRIIGPNSVGLMVPPVKLNASFCHIAPQRGRLALLSQSGAIATSLIDWAADKQIGFSHVVSLGDMADVDVADYLDMLTGDHATKAILLYLESIPNPRKFMSAARAAARIKPVVAIKPGRHAQAAKAAATHTGALSGVDRVVDAALSRAGILRVNGLGELFEAAETIGRFQPLERSRVGIVSNGGGAGVLAVDKLIDCGGELSELTPETIKRLDAVLPPTWSRANPVDIIGDAPAERYKAAVLAVAEDPETDALIVMDCPTALASPSEAAETVAGLTKDGKINGKPMLACWLGEVAARKGREILHKANIANFSTPAEAARAVSYLTNWSRAQQALMRVPSRFSEDVDGDRDAVLAIFRQVAGEGRKMLTEPEAKAAIAAYGIHVPETLVAKTPAEAKKAAGKLLKQYNKVVVKVLSAEISHKSDVGGVVLNIDCPEAAGEAAEAIRTRLAKHKPDAAIEGFAVQPMIVRGQGHVLILGMSRDPVFGPIVLFGSGGTAVEVLDDTAIVLPPVDEVLAGDLIDRTRIGRLLAGFRDQKAADRGAIIGALNGLSQMVVDFPCIVAMDINPLLADSKGAVALDARIEIDPAAVEETGPNPALAIRPYPGEWCHELVTDGLVFDVRPIKPSDVALYPDFFAKVSPEDIRMRFFAQRKNFSDTMLKRLTQLDYDREIAFVALEKETGALAGIGRLASDPDRAVAEYGLLVRTDLQGHGLGWALLKQLIEFARYEGIGRIEGLILNENEKMLGIARDLGFEVHLHPDEHGLSLSTLALN